MHFLVPQFLTLGAGGGLGDALPEAYTWWMVVLSVIIAALAACAALAAAGRMTVAKDFFARRAWHVAGAMALGIGVWSMHFIGMLAFTLPVPVEYDLVVTLISMVPSILAAGWVLHVIGQGQVTLKGIVIGGVMMGVGIGAMHYTGMAAMRMDALMFYDPWLFALSVVVAVVLSITALYMALLATRDLRSIFHWTTVGAAIGMGIAISGMHYTGMAAAHFYPGDGAHAVDITTFDPVWLAVWIGTASFIFMGLVVIITAAPGRRESLGRRFSFTLTSIVALVLFGFAIAAIFLNIQNVHNSLQGKLSSAANLASVSLRTPLWNVDVDALEDFFEALLLDSDVVFAQVIDDGDDIMSLARPDHQGTKFESFQRSEEFLVQTAPLSYEETAIGTLRLVVSRENVRQEILLNVGGIVALTTLLVVGIAVSSTVISKRYIARPLSSLQHSATLIAGGELDTLIDTTSLDEIGLLARDLDTMREAIRERNAELEEINRTLEQRVEERTSELGQANAEISALNEQLKAENLRMGAELEVTRRIQQMLLPTTEELNTVDGLEIAGYMEPAEEVGGDYYDVLQHNGHVKIGIGDVTGHGLESGVMMVMVQTVVRALLAHGETDPVIFLDTINRALYGNAQRMGTDKNLTLSLIDYADGEVRLSGQHEEMIVMRQNGELELVDTVNLGFPIALDSEIAQFIDHTTVKLAVGDGVVLYTDGITEAENVDNEQFGLERLCEVIRQHWSEPAEAIKNAVVSAVTHYIGQQTVYDDITLVVVKQR